MRRTFKRSTKARLSFPGGPHVPVNMVDSMEKPLVGLLLDSKRRWNSWRISRICENLVYKIKRCTTHLTCHFLRFCFFTNIHFFNTIRHVNRSMLPPDKLSLALVSRSYVLRMIVKLALYFPIKSKFKKRWNSHFRIERQWFLFLIFYFHYEKSFFCWWSFLF